MLSLLTKRSLVPLVLLLFMTVLSSSIVLWPSLESAVPTSETTLAAEPALAAQFISTRSDPVPSPEIAFQALQARAAGPLDVTWDSVTGIPRFVGARGNGALPYTPTAAERGNPIAIARGFLDQNRALFRLRSAAEEFRLLRLEPDLQLNYQHVRLDQMYKGIPVFGRQLVVHLDPAERIVAVNGGFAPSINIITQPLVRQADAEALAVADIVDTQLTDEERNLPFQADVLKDRTQLTVYVDDTGKPTLTWKVTILSQAPLGQWYIFVNARRPVVTHRIDATADGKRRVTFTARNGTDIPGRKLMDEGERSNDSVAQAAHDGAGRVYDFYFNNFKRDSLDGRGMPMVSTVHYGASPEEAENAAWIGEAQQMIYGDGGRIFKPLAYGLDVVGHEFTHGVIDNTAQLVYETQSGALNESYADVFGVLIAGSNWTVGSSVVKSPPFPLPFLRSLSDPNAGVYNPRNPLSGVGQPADMSQYANLPNSRRADNGGVHINSGIPSRAAFLVSQALGNDRTAQVYYRTVTQYLSPTANFLEAANATARAAQDLYGADAVNGVRNAWGQVGINVGGSDSGPSAPGPQQPQRPSPQAPAPTPSPSLPAGCTDIVNDGGFENDTAWRQVMGKGTTGIIDPENPHTGARSAWLGGTDKEPLQYIYQDLRIPANATQIQLNYYRYLHEETSGLSGLFAADATFNVLIANSQGEVQGTIEQLKSSQADDTWEQARFDATPLAGKTIRLVFSAENPRGNVSSMFVDDVQMVVCTTGTPPSAPPTSSNNLVYLQGTISDADTGRGVQGVQVFIMKPGISATQAAADDNVTASEVITLGVTDGAGVYQTQQPIPRGQAYSVIMIARGYRPIVADNGINVPADASNPHKVDATLRKR